MRFFLLLLTIFIVPLWLNGCDHPVKKAKTITYFEESPIAYQLFFTVYRHGKVIASIKRAEGYPHQAGWKTYSFEETLSKEEAADFFDPIDTLACDKKTVWPAIPRGSKSFRLDVVFPDKTQTIKSKLQAIIEHESLSAFQQAVTAFFQTRLPATEPQNITLQ